MPATPRLAPTPKGFTRDHGSRHLDLCTWTYDTDSGHVHRPETIRATRISPFAAARLAAGGMTSLLELLATVVHRTEAWTALQLAEQLRPRASSRGPWVVPTGGTRSELYYKTGIGRRHDLDCDSLILIVDLIEASLADNRHGRSVWIALQSSVENRLSSHQLYPGRRFGMEVTYRGNVGPVERDPPQERCQERHRHRSGTCAAGTMLGIVQSEDAQIVWASATSIERGRRNVEAMQTRYADNTF
ncbi:hypothetical protein V8E36_001575 [Tilletia maclaganii]